MVRTVEAMQYVTPLREGGSMPAIVEASDGELYVMKFLGAGQGAKALIAELLAGEIARHLGMWVPEIVLMELAPGFGQSEPDPEIQDILRNSSGINLGMRYLSGASAFDLLLTPAPSAELASQIVWFDAFVTNVDRTPHNVNMLIWQQGLWLIDHGACLYFHHDWRNDWESRSHTPFSLIRDHTLISLASMIEETDTAIHARLSPAVIRSIVDLIPEDWLGEESIFPDSAAHRQAYATYLTSRLAASSLFCEEAIRAHRERV